MRQEGRTEVDEPDVGAPIAGFDRTTVELSREEGMRLLAGVPFGRIVFTRNALPAVRPVRHLIDGELLIVRADVGSGFSQSVRNDRSVVIAYEADDIDVDRRLGWSVVVTGLAHPVTAPALVHRYSARLGSWIGADDQLIAVEPTLITAIALAEVTAA
ncbi:pyridoxamine 5'-phosphate oxidase family protein [Nocardia jiangsuensis]|uniref:Pyridoxamine 5'-phosphate oxidase family protein n=1 Tax=Nocardia jiangsuensis TaxID=1691563 RepID=A0ABV8DPF0_9NOCA